VPRSLPIAFVAALFAGVPFVASRATAADDLERDIFVGTLDADGLASERAWIDPLDVRSGMLGFSLRGALARWVSPVGPTMRMDLELIVHLPLDRLLGTAGRPVSAWDGGEQDPALLGIGGAMKTKHARWGTLAALPGAMALGGVAAAKTKPPKAPTTLTATTVGSASSAPSGTISMPLASASGSVSASTKTSSAVAPSATITTTESKVAGVTTYTSAPLVPAAVLRGLVSAAWHTAGLDRDETLDDIASRAKSSALAPEVRLRAMRTLSYGARILTADALADRTTLSDGTETLLEARLTWRLDRLVFADEEVGIERVKLDRAELKQRLASRIVELTIAWTRGRRAAANVDLLPQEREEAAMVAMEAILALDAFTGGAATELLHP
jgi:hypothetical protein